MTAVICWERQVGPLTELVIASDSRLSGGETWDACPKLFNIGRPDAVLAFAGDTHRAYPFVLQVLSTIASYRGSQRRSLDITQLTPHLVQVLNYMVSIAEGPLAEAAPACEFILGGWSWRLGRFRAYNIVYEDAAKRFVSFAANRAPKVIGGLEASSVYSTIGDAGHAATSRMAAERRGAALPLDMVPLETIASLSLSPKFHSVGGPPQVMKVYRHMITETFAVQWAGSETISGRPLLPKENHDLRVFHRNDNGTWSILGAREQASSH